MSGLLGAGVLYSGYVSASVVVLGASASSVNAEDGASFAAGFADSGMDSSPDTVRMALLSVMSGQSYGAAASKAPSGEASEKFNVRDGGAAGNQHGPYSIEESEDGTGGGSQVIESVPAVPLPASAWLMLSGMAGLMVTFRRRVSV